MTRFLSPTFSGHSIGAFWPMHKVVTYVSWPIKGRAKYSQAGGQRETKMLEMSSYFDRFRKWWQTEQMAVYFKNSWIRASALEVVKEGLGINGIK